MKLSSVLVGVGAFVAGGLLVASAWRCAVSTPQYSVVSKNGRLELRDKRGNQMVFIEMDVKGFNQCTVYNASGPVAYVQYMVNGPPSVMNAIVQVESKAHGKKTFQMLNSDYREDDSESTPEVIETARP